MLRRIGVPGLLIALWWAGDSATAADERRGSPLSAVPLQQVAIDDPFWSPKLEVWRAVTIPDCFGKFERDRGGAIDNFDRVRDGRMGVHAGPEWYDGLIYEMIRGSSDFLSAKKDPALERRLDGYIDRIAAAAARDPSGYLNTWTQTMAPQWRWGLNGGNDVQQHDVYNAGCLVEAAVHHYRATRKVKLLQVATKLANHMADVMGLPPKKNIVPGHSLPEEALVKLYVLFAEQPDLKKRMDAPVDERRYLRLAEFWIENRGNHKGRDFGKFRGSYAQDHLPVLQQTTIEGHAVRATLLCAGLVAAANVNGREDYLAAARRLWENMVDRRMYVIGGLGAVAGHEGFGPDYDLPNDGYLETCAAIGAAFFHHNLNLATGDARCADELERALYNAALPGVSLSGDSYFYENPLQAGPQRRRWAWHACPCCPPMFLKLMGALPSLVYARNADSLFVNLFVGSRASVALSGVKVAVSQQTRYPWDGTVRIRVEPERAAEFSLCLRLPGWCERPSVSLNGATLASIDSAHGYARIKRNWQPGDEVVLSLPMPIRRVKANPKVLADVGRAALQRGPLVYCLEGVDNRGEVRNLVIPPDAPLKATPRPEMLGGIVVVEGTALAVHASDWSRPPLYRAADSIPGASRTPFVAIPYFANANRGPTQMAVWIADEPSRIQPPPAPTIASRAKPTASHCWPGDTLAALNDQIAPKASDDASTPRFTWWDHRGTKEWVQYDFDAPQKVSAVSVYWWDERRVGRHCRVPQSWRVLYRVGDEWRPVAPTGPYGVELDAANRVPFAPVAASAIRIEAQLQTGWSAGILEWTVE